MSVDKKEQNHKSVRDTLTGGQMKKFFALTFAVLMVCALFAACGVDTVDDGNDGVIESNRTSYTGKNAMRDAAEEIRSNVSDYYHTRLGLYGDDRRGTFGYDYAAGYNNVYGTDYPSGFGTGSTRGFDNDRNNSVINGEYDSNANQSSNLDSTTQIADPKSESGLVKNGSDKTE